MRAIGYIRVSTEEQATEGVSLEAQSEKILQYANLYNIHLGAVFEDAGVSASVLERPGLQQALDALKSGDFDGLIVAKLDRLTRSLPHLLHLVEEYFDDEYSLVSVAEQLDPRTASGRLVMNILGAVAQWELETIRERTKAALAHKRARGEYTGGGVPYGYRNGDGELREDEREQQAITMAKVLRKRGDSLRRIGEILPLHGYLPRNGGKWHASQIKILVAE